MLNVGNTPPAANTKTDPKRGVVLPVPLCSLYEATRNLRILLRPYGSEQGSRIWGLGLRV